MTPLLVFILVFAIFMLGVFVGGTPKQNTTDKYVQRSRNKRMPILFNILTNKK